MQRCKVFKSARSPVRLVFNSVPTSSILADGSVAENSPQTRGASPGPSPWAEDGRVPRAPRSEAGTPVVQLLFKSGDDLRQDQFVCQVCLRTLTALPCLALLSCIVLHRLVK